MRCGSGKGGREMGQRDGARRSVRKFGRVKGGREKVDVDEGGYVLTINWYGDGVVRVWWWSSLIVLSEIFEYRYVQERESGSEHEGVNVLGGLGKCSAKARRSDGTWACVDAGVWRNTGVNRNANTLVVLKRGMCAKPNAKL